MKKNIDIFKLTMRQKAIYKKEHPKAYRAYVSAIRSSAGKKGGINKGKSVLY